MNKIVKQTQELYRKERERVSYSIFDIEAYLKKLAEKGLIWILKDMKDTSEIEGVATDYYLNKYKENQIYDHLENIPYQHPLGATSTTTPCQFPQKTVPEQKVKQTKKQQYLEVRDVKLFLGYKRAKELEEKIIKICRDFPPYEIDHIVDQIERSAGSTKERIERAEQVYVGEKYNQYSIAIGSAKETSTWLQISLGRKYITKVQFEELDNLVTQVVRILTKNLSNIKGKEGKGMNLPSPYTPDVNNFGAYNNALLLVEKIYDITMKPRYRNDKNFVKKMRKRATSCAANIAEAHQLYMSKKFSFFNTALEALNGLDSHLDTSMTKGIISEEELIEINELRVSIRNVLLTKMANMSKEKAS